MKIINIVCICISRKFYICTIAYCSSSINTNICAFFHATFTYCNSLTRWKIDIRVSTWRSSVSIYFRSTGNSNYIIIVIFAINATAISSLIICDFSTSHHKFISLIVMKIYCSACIITSTIFNNTARHIHDTIWSNINSRSFTSAVPWFTRFNGPAVHIK